MSAMGPIAAVANLIERIETRVAGQGRLLVRYSGTEPLLRVMLEGRREDEIRCGGPGACGSRGPQPLAHAGAHDEDGDGPERDRDGISRSDPEKERLPH